MEEQKNKEKGAIFRVLGAEKVFKHLPYVYLIAVLALVYIANVHYGERMLREREHLKEEVQRSRWRYMSVKSSFMNETTQSKVEAKVKDMNLKPLNSMPYTIKLDN